MLYVLRKAKPQLRKQILKYSDTELIKTICEIVINLLAGNIQLKKSKIKKLLKYKKDLRCLTCPKRSLTSKRNIIVQRGGALIPMLIGSVLSGVIGSILDRYNKN